MDPIEAARKHAARIHAETVEDGGDPWQPFEIAVKALERHGLWHQPVVAGDVSLNGGRARLDPKSKGVVYGETGSLGGDALLIGHELGHVVMHGGNVPIVTTRSDPARSAESGNAVERLADYGRGERREVQADLFARELILPRATARLHHRAGMTASEIAGKLGVGTDVVMQQMLDALLLPVVQDEAPDSEAGSLLPDPSQDIAVAHRDSPFLLQAGPGTGKTRTLVKRIASLVDEGIDPNGILVLTFSNKAAGELMDRLAETRPEASASVWTGTFHSFGLDVIRRFHERLGLSASPKLVDKATAITMLERVVASLPLEHYRDLWDPTTNLSDVLSAISRAKDELVGPTRYRELADAMVVVAEDDPARLRGKRAVEEAIIYDAYERLLAAEDALDFGDLIMKPVMLMANHPEIAEALALRHRHILVDEYQDVNLATVRFIKALAADDGERLWVVGDVRQSIYRFRGATSASMGAFKADYPGARIESLGVNYRSRAEIVDTFSAFATGVEAFKSFEPLSLEPARGACGRKPTLYEAGTPNDEISVVAASILSAQASGTKFRDQAILCTANDRLTQFADGLTARGIPVLYLGPIFERPEIKDLLCLLSLLHDPRAASIVRVSKMPGFEMGLSDVAAVANYLAAHSSTPLSWLDGIGSIDGITPKAATALGRLRDACAGFAERAHPWTVASVLAVDRLGIAGRIDASDTLADRMRGVAIWQFLNFLKSLPSEGEYPTQTAQHRIRQLIALDEDKSLRHFPDAALQIDAVRVMTIHGCKGLEFRMVHAPGLIKTGVPRGAKPPSCPPPDKMIAGSEDLTGVEASVAGHDEQEACLFFVLLSRARDDLRLYRSTKQKNGTNRNASEYLSKVARTLGASPMATALHGPTILAGSGPVPVVWEVPFEVDPRHLDSYGRCGLRFFYTYLLGLGGRRGETPYMLMHNAVQETIRWLDRNFDAAVGAPDGFDEAFEAAWIRYGPVEHGHADAYRAIAGRMLRFLIELRSEPGRMPPADIRLEAGGGHVVLRPHDVVRDPDGTLIVRRVSTGRALKSIETEIEYAILHAAAEEAYSDNVIVEAVHLSSETRQHVPMPAAKRAQRLATIAGHMTNIRSGIFPPNPGRACLRCPHLHACPGLPDGDTVVRRVLVRGP